MAQEVNSDLQENAAKYEVEMNGGGAIAKWQFGPYGILKGKNKWTDGATRSVLFHDKLKQRKVERSHFIMEHRGGPQYTVNIGSFSKFIAEDWAKTKDFEISGEGWISFGQSNEKVDVYSLSTMASITSTAVEDEWRMVMLNFGTAYDYTDRTSLSEGSKWKITSRKTDVSDVNVPETDFLGVLTNGKIEIRINPSITIEDTGSILPSFRMLTEFYRGDTALAALEIYGLKMDDRAVYIRKGLDNDVEQALAAAIMVLMAG